MEATTEHTLPIAVTIGEPSGIGPEVILKAWYKRKENGLNPFFVIGSADILQKQAADLNLKVPLSVIASPLQAVHVFENTLPVIDLTSEGDFEFGAPTQQTASMVIGAIDKAVELILNGKARAMATAPIHKAALYSAGFASPGHTEYLAELCYNHTGENCHPVMMLASEQLCVVPLTIHVALSQVPALLDQKLLIRTIGTVHDAMKNYFGLPFPRIAVAGLNPHAGEDNSMGTEDSEIIAPVIEMLKKKAIHVNGPMPADTMFHKSARAKYDVAICMYHDQALIPIKTIDFDAGVNVTLGLPIIRTSPDHGTALDIAGRSLANPTSMINSLKLADRMSKNIKAPEEDPDEQ
tara:strand:- start:44018 stop:45070 length:1053 start_codon:yes stop_codon:yes gene_type:complete